MAKIIYIAGYGRSGSTILDTLLGNHPLIFGSGELAHFFAEWLRDASCSCGEKLSDCLFWQEVMDHLWATLPNLELVAAKQVTRRIESSLRRLSIDSDAHNEFYCSLWKAMTAAISQVSGKKIIVDSSKSGRRCARRIQTLSRLCGLDVSVIHLVRDPRAVMWSTLRGSNRKLEADQPAALSGGAYRALISWGMANASVHLTKATIPQLKLIRLKYEDVMGNPVKELHKLGIFLDMNLEPVINSITEHCPLDPGHGARGNRARRQGPIWLELDEEWKEALPNYARRLALLSWPLAHRYGYDVFSIV
jgi:hypothetical protein